MHIPDAKKSLIILALEGVLAATLWWGNPAGGREYAPRHPCLANVAIARDSSSTASGHLMVFPAGSQWIFNLSWRANGTVHVLHRQLDVHFQDLGMGRYRYLVRSLARYRDDTADDVTDLFPMIQPGADGAMTFTPVADGLFNVQVNEDLQFYCTEQ
ncbi:MULTISPECIES: hypothetical protein [unclassified Paludibacterium]|uniref:hypothetical protein n=1 Tax=unclassified Paludibacterium TaxID=2618429 RepID=UPI001C051E43|nr:hypothetical protein [Paludibacterium sp. B53371]BEV70902.1 hypothetical protein THUN1379_03840 [Paludibacterium sp. THUN1379]